MGDNVLKSIEEMFNESQDVDNRETFGQLWAITCELFEKVKDRFELQKDPGCPGKYKGLDGESGGLLDTYAGPEIDWLVLAWTGNPQASFTNMHLTITLGPQVNVPNFGFALGTTPDLFAYMDFLPRVDYITDVDYVQRYYDGAPNKMYLDMAADTEFKAFVSHHMYTRVSLSPNALCLSAAGSDDNIKRLRDIAHERMDLWLQWVDEAPATPIAQRAALAERDLMIRRTVAEVDPANVVGEKMFGKELCDQLVEALWGGKRQLPRALDMHNATNTTK